MTSKISKRYDFEWKIHNFTKEIVDDLKFAKCFVSNEFQIILGTNNETKWHFKLYVRDSGLSIYLQKVHVDLENFTVIFGINTNKMEELNNYEFCSKNKSNLYRCSRGWSDFIKTEEVFNDPQRYLRNDTLKLGLKVELIQDNETDNIDCEEQSPEYGAIMTKIEEYFDTKCFYDYTFFCSDGVEVQAHRMILAMNSDVMKARFLLNIDETEYSTALIKDIDGETMNEITRFLYTKKIKNIIGLESRLLYGAEKYELEDLKNHCVDLMTKNLCIENALDYLILSVQYELIHLQKSSAMFIKLNYKTVCDERNDWNKLEVKHWRVLLEYFRRNDSYIQVFESTLTRETLHNFSFDSFIRT
ncbi:speckle-type POZ protein B-like [Chironomus tepperi]|uniref:speckle-type POZ protein B-like n=1 Tax=Chironomus tepperi TaxID=113505 RepID=UPI00391FB16E